MKKSVLITGSSGLIGSEMVREFLAQGYVVYGVDKKPNGLLQHPDYKFIACDLAQENQIKKIFRKIKSLDVLINNAALADPTAPPLEELSMKQWHDTMAVDLTSHVIMTKLSIPLLRKTKGGLDAFTRALAISYSHEIRVNSISPCWIADPKDRRKSRDHLQHPVGRVGLPADVAKLALFLASEESGFIMGQDFVIDGGMSVKMIYEE
jgi:NAD(P)-dependent dehydrogenase (short-subunit alcohol dehydrogenase family)